MRDCTACGKALELVWDDDPDKESTTQYDNALEIIFDGGYGMFIDPVEEHIGGVVDIRNSKYYAIICHECAHALCKAVPWIAQFLRPYSSHSHTTAYHDANSQHWGWDYPTAHKK